MCGKRPVSSSSDIVRRSVSKNHNSQPKGYERVSIMKKNEMQFDEEELHILRDFELSLIHI